jgi:ubiquitin-protein ligase
MSSPRIRRLNLDHENLQKQFSQWPPVRITQASGMPPEHYQFEFNLKGLYIDPSGEILERPRHVLDVNLSLGYPRRAPHCKMLTPVFHPNFDDTSVCIGDFWAASEGLDDLVVRIGRMITFQEYNTKSPLNGLAAKWADENENLLPVDNTEVAPPNPDLPHSSNDEWGDQSIVINDAISPATKTAQTIATPTRLHLSSSLKITSMVVACLNCQQPMGLEARHLNGKSFICPKCKIAHEVRTD